MGFVAALLGLFFVLVVLLDAFETIVLPRTVVRRVRLSNMFFDVSAHIYRWLGKQAKCGSRQSTLVAYAPLLLIALIILWAVLIVFGFALIHYGLGTPFHGDEDSLGGITYYSGVTFFTLGFGDIVPTQGLGRALCVVESGLGFGFLAMLIGYFPVLYGSFSRREVQMLLLDSKAGSEPMGFELIRRHGEAKAMPMLTPLLKEWERFAAELLESYLSYPLLAYYRSQHDDSSWLKSLTAILDACALIEVGFENDEPWEHELRFQARATFAMARHVLVDLAYILDVPPIDGELTRLSEEGLAQIEQDLRLAGVPLIPVTQPHLDEIREIYEPYCKGLSHALVLDLPKWCDQRPHVDNWQTSAWEGAKHF